MHRHDHCSTLSSIDSIWLSNLSINSLVGIYNERASLVRMNKQYIYAVCRISYEIDIQLQGFKKVPYLGLDPQIHDQRTDISWHCQ